MMLSSLFTLPTVTFSSPGAIAFKIGTWPVRWYGVLIAIAFLIAYCLAENLAKKNNLSLESFNDLIFLILIFSLVFARLYFVLLSWGYFKNHLDEIPKIWLGGQSIHGGIIGAVFAAVIYSKIKKIPFYRYMDVIAVITPLGQSIGRWGNFFNNEAFGKPVSNWIFRLKVPIDSRPENFLNCQYFHPTFLYESFLDFLIFIFLYKQYSKWSNKPGKTFWIYLLSYSVIRFFLEFLRIDSLYVFNLFPCAQAISVIIFVISLIFLSKR